jgi:23S rRNA (uracil1939-C5)-methyltransferase
MSTTRAQLTIESLNANGQGVGRFDGSKVVIDGTLPGEEVVVELRRRRRRFVGKLISVIEPSGERVAARCVHFGLCGGCSLQHLDYAAQLRLKQVRLLETLAAAGLKPENTLPALAGWPWGYRHKARLSVKYVPKKGGVVVGFRERGLRLVADLRQCEVLAPAVGAKISLLREVLTGLEGRAHIPQVEVAVGDAQAALVLRCLQPLGAGDCEALRQFAREENLRVYVQSGGPGTVTALWPQDGRLLSYRLPQHALDFHFSATDFTQVNLQLNRALVAQAVSLLAPEPNDAVLELYSGLGNFALPLALHAGHVTGLEADPESVMRAQSNAKRNQVANVTFHAADLSVPAVRAHWLRKGWDKVLLDPPRSGAPAVMQDLVLALPSRVVYVSCCVATLARDSAVLVGAHGYRLTRAGIIDMFPHTNHVESMSVFERG